MMQLIHIMLGFHYDISTFSYKCQTYPLLSCLSTKYLLPPPIITSNFKARYCSAISQVVLPEFIDYTKSGWCCMSDWNGRYTTHFLTADLNFCHIGIFFTLCSVIQFSIWNSVAASQDELAAAFISHHRRSRRHVHQCSVFPFSI